MANFLQLNGVGTWMKTPTITFDRIVIDFVSHTSPSKIYIDARNGIASGYLQRTGGATPSDNWGAGISVVKVDGVAKVNNQSVPVIPSEVRTTLDVQFAAVGTDDVNLFSSVSNTNGMEVDVYAIWFYNGSTVAAYYDMSTGTVQDQSGNGKHATLNGGAWIEYSTNKYLSMDGVDDRAFTPAMAATEFILEMKPRPVAWEQYINFVGNAVNRNGSNQDQFAAAFSAVYVDGVQATTNTAFVKLDTRQIVRGVLSAPSSGSNGSNVFWNGGAAYMEGELYSLKIYNGSELLAHYNMTQGDLMTGKLYDLSGNARHATLTGGTWSTEGGGSVPGSVSYATKQTITASGSVSYATRQRLTLTGSAAMATKQILNRTASTAYATLQAIISGSVPGSSVFATKQVIRLTAATLHATKQAFTAAGSAAHATRQIITQPGAFITVATKQIINNPNSITAATQQRLFATGSAAFATKQRFGLVGSRVYATLQEIVDANNAIARQVSITGKANRAAIDGEVSAENKERRVSIGGEI